MVNEELNFRGHGDDRTHNFSLRARYFSGSAYAAFVVAIMTASRATLPKKDYPSSAEGYKIICEIGHGGSATVFKAVCLPYDETVAVKILDIEKIQGDIQVIVVWLSIFCLF
jgi:serine/threonine protein kinase